MKKLLLALLTTAMFVCFLSCKNERIAKSFYTIDTITVVNFSGIEIRVNDNIDYKNAVTLNPEMLAGEEYDNGQEPSIISIVW